MYHLAALLTAVALVPGSAAAQTVSGPAIRGWVADSTGRAVAFARVTGDGLGERVADDSGRFFIAMPRPAQVRLEVRRIGYQPLTFRVQINGDTTLRLVMEALPASLAKIQIEAEATVRSLELVGFYQRLRDKERGANTGHFILPEVIEQRRGTVAQVVTGTPGLRVERYKLSPRSPAYSALFGNSRTLGKTLCPMTVYLNRMRLSPPREGVPVDIGEYVNLGAVAGIEIYTRSNTPFEFAMLSGNCGVVVIWTK